MSDIIQPVSKVVFGDKTLIDLTKDTVSPDTLLETAKAHGSDGLIFRGEIPVNHGIDETIEPSSAIVIPSGYYAEDIIVRAVWPTLNGKYSAIERKSNIDISDRIIYDNVGFIDTTNVPNSNSGTYEAKSRSDSLDMGATNSYRYVKTSGVPNSNTESYTVETSSSSLDLGETNKIRYLKTDTFYTSGYSSGIIQGQAAGRAQGLYTQFCDTGQITIAKGKGFTITLDFVPDIVLFVMGCTTLGSTSKSNLVIAFRDYVNQKCYRVQVNSGQYSDWTESVTTRYIPQTATKSWTGTAVSSNNQYIARVFAWRRGY